MDDKTMQLSIIMPWYKKMLEFNYALKTNLEYFENEKYEIVIVLDEPSEEQKLLDKIKAINTVKWRVVVNDIAHAWRNPASTINVGIRNSLGEYCLVISPESMMVSDVPSILLNAVNERNAFAYGYCIWGNINNKGECRYSSFDDSVPFGSICFRRKDAENTHGYPEGYNRWGQDDVIFRKLLRRLGVAPIGVKDAIMLHMTHPGRSAENSTVRSLWAGPPAKSNGDNWGRDFDRIAFDWIS